MKHSKRKLINSLLALLLCFSMLVGSTFAWFTDSVSTGINTIAAGNLDVELYHSNAAVSDEPVDSSTKLFLDLQGNPILWEPGVVSYENLRVTNEGDLALAYQMAIATAGENFVVDPSGAQYGLSQILKVGVVAGGITATDRASVVASVEEANWTTLSQFVRTSSLMAEGKGESEEVWGLVIYWEPGEYDNYWNLNNGKILSSGEVLSIDLGINLIATQEEYEADAFGTDYDAEAKAFVFPDFVGGTADADVTVDDQRQTTEEVTMTSGAVSAVVPAGVKVAEGVSKLTLTVTPKDSSEANVSLGENEDILSLDVHIEGVDPANTAPIAVTLKEVAPTGLNMGNYKLYHVENGTTNEMTLIGSGEAFSAHNQFKYDPVTGDVVLYMATFSEVAVVADLINPWKGDFDYSWYVGEGPYTIANADQLAGFGAIVGGMNGKKQDDFNGKEVKLTSDINIGDTSSDNDLVFYPIGYYNNTGSYKKASGGSVTSSVSSFSGTFDGQGHTIANFYQNTWEMFGDYNSGYSGTPNHYKDAMGLFGYVYNGTIKNLTVDNFSSDGEYTPTGVIAAYAAGDAEFENIAIFNCNPRVYNTGNGGIIGIAGDTSAANDDHITLTNITVDNSNKISALWGSYDVACGGLVGMYRGNVDGSGKPTDDTISFTNSHVSAIMDVYNDVCGNYQYYAYRYAGMIIGSVRHNTTNADGKTIPNMAGISASGCTVNYGTWNDYYYCEFKKNGHPSYSGPDDYKFSRVPNSEIDTSNGKENATCIGHNHTDVEDNRAIYLPFHQLFTGYGWGVNSIGLKEYSGIVTDLGITEGTQSESVVKFERNPDFTAEVEIGTQVRVGDLFVEKTDASVEVKDATVQVAVSGVNGSNITAEFAASTTDKWEDGTLTFKEIDGLCSVTIQDYNFCKPTTIILKDGKLHDLQKFNIVFPNVNKYLYRVGNMNEIALSSLFAEEGVVIDENVNITIEGLDGFTYKENKNEWEKGTIHFNKKTGLAKITIDEAGVGTTTLNVEVVDAMNATSATSATSNNVVLLNDCGFGSLDVKNGYTLYGNGFTLTCSSDSVAVDRSYGFIVLTNGTLDNVNVVAPNFSHAILFDSNKIEGGNPSQTDSNGRTRYNNIRSAVVMNGNSNILNSSVSGGRAAVYAANGNAVIANSTIKGGAAANVHVESSAAVTLRDITLIQKPTKANVNDTTKTLMGLSVVTLCNSEGNGGVITLEGKLRQYAWARESYKQYVPEAGQDLVSTALSQTGFTHTVTFDDGVEATAVNMGIAYIPDGLSKTTTNGLSDNRDDSEKTNYPYDDVDVSSAKVYTYGNSMGTQEDVKTEPEYTPNQQASSMPNVMFKDVSDARKFDTAYDEKLGWTATLSVNLDEGNYSFSFANLIVKKNGQELNYTVKTSDGAIVDKNTAIELSDTGAKEYTLQITDNLIYNENGEVTGKTETRTYTFKLLSTRTSIKGPEWKKKPTPSADAVKNIKKSSISSDWSLAIPVLKDAVITYWSKSNGKYVDLDLTTLTPTTNGKQANGANEWSVSVDGEYTLKITSSAFKTNYDGMPVVYEENGTKTLYYTVNNSNGCLGSGTKSRNITITYTFTDSNNKVLADNTVVWSINKSDMSSTTINYDTFVKGGGSSDSGSSDTCVTSDTLITLADGTQKRIDELTYDDELLVWDFYNGEYTSAPISIIYAHEEMVQPVLYLNFSDGTTVKVISSHGFFDTSANNFVYISEENVAEFIGHTFVKENNGNYAEVKLKSFEVIDELTTAYWVQTAVHNNAVTEGMLSITTPDYDGWFDYFNINDDMKYDEKHMQEEIAKYGLTPYDELSYLGSYETYIALNAQYLNILIGRGVVTMEEILELFEMYA